MNAWRWITLFGLVATAQSLAGMLLGFHPYLTERGVYGFALASCISAVFLIARSIQRRS